MAAYPTAPDGWTRVTPDETKPFEYYYERGIATIWPRYNVNEITHEAYSGKPLLERGISGYRVNVNGRYGGDFKELSAAKESALISMRNVFKKGAVRR